MDGFARRARTRLAITANRATARHAAAGLAAVTGLAVFVLAHEVFPYLSYNHDEAVYLQQAAMLLDGTLTLDPPVTDAFRPWFFVEDGGRLYPKYSPVPAAMFAVGSLLGDVRIALALIAAAVVVLTDATVAEAFDRRTGLVAAALLVATPLFLIQASVFLPYVPTLAWLLLFAWAFLRADRTGDWRLRALAGLAIGVAFFARPFTAVLFATPFVLVACWTVFGEGLSALARQGITAAVGLLGVVVALGYNARLTGSPLRFPYQAFAPRDGPGFGYRSLWGHGIEYTPDLAIESASVALSTYVFEWSVAAPIGAILAVVGLGLVARRGRSADPRRLVLGGLFVAIPAGHLYFWGTLNAIGNLDAPGLGLMGHLGPYYHLALVVPTAAFGAHALVAGHDRLRPRLAGMDGRPVRAGVAVVLLVVALAVGGTAVAGVAGTVEDNCEVTSAYATAYEPIERTSFENAVVFLPTPHGPWLAHPFQYLHNDPGLDGEVVYAQDREVFAVLAAFPDRTPYRYTYRGEWLPVDGQTVEPRLQRLDYATGEAVRLDVSAGVPSSTHAVVVSAATDDGDVASDTLTPTDDGISLSVTVRDGRARVTAPSFEEPLTVPVDDRDSLAVTLFVDAGGLDSMGYGLDLPVHRDDGTVAVLSPRERVCTDGRLCREGGAYVPGVHSPGVSLSTELSVVEAPPNPSDE